MLVCPKILIFTLVVPKFRPAWTESVCLTESVQGCQLEQTHHIFFQMILWTVNINQVWYHVCKTLMVPSLLKCLAQLVNLLAERYYRFLSVLWFSRISADIKCLLSNLSSSAIVCMGGISVVFPDGQMNFYWLKVNKIQDDYFCQTESTCQKKGSSTICKNTVHVHHHSISSCSYACYVT